MSTTNMRRHRSIFGVIALTMLLGLSMSGSVFVTAQNCNSYNDQGQCIAWGGAGGYANYEEWKEWQEYQACVDAANALNDDDDDTNDVDVDEECDRPDTYGGNPI